MQIVVEEILVSAIQNDFDKCKALIDKYADSFKEEILSFHGSDEEDWIPITKDIYYFPFVRGYYFIGVSRYWFLQIASVLSSVGKEDIILPLLEEITELIWKTATKNAIAEGTVISEEIMYEWYDIKKNCLKSKIFVQEKSSLLLRSVSLCRWKH